MIMKVVATAAGSAAVFPKRSRPIPAAVPAFFKVPKRVRLVRRSTLMLKIWQIILITLPKTKVLKKQIIRRGKIKAGSLKKTLRLRPMMV